MSKLTFMEAQLEEARDALHEALRSADRLGLVGSCIEIHRAMSHVNSVLVEMDRKTEAEFAPYRDAVGAQQPRGADVDK